MVKENWIWALSEAEVYFLAKHRTFLGHKDIKQNH